MTEITKINAGSNQSGDKVNQKHVTARTAEKPYYQKILESNLK